jgi:hypothetical protein
MIVDGLMCDGNPLNYWYSVDWMQINVDLQVSNAVINGSNQVPPLYYNQSGINRLDIVAQRIAGQGVSYGLALGPVNSYQLSSADFNTLLASGKAPLGVITNAVPFASYTTLNPLDYPLGQYSGLSVSYTPARGFQTITFNINVSNFVAG